MRSYTAWHAIARLACDIALVIKALRLRREIPPSNGPRDINSRAANQRLFGPLGENMPSTAYIVRDRIFTK
jgi:hypothetical protein